MLSSRVLKKLVELEGQDFVEVMSRQDSETRLAVLYAFGFELEGFSGLDKVIAKQYSIK